MLQAQKLALRGFMQRPLLMQPVVHGSMLSCALLQLLFELCTPALLGEEPLARLGKLPILLFTAGVRSTQFLLGDARRVLESAQFSLQFHVVIFDRRKGGARQVGRLPRLDTAGSLGIWKDPYQVDGAKGLLLASHHRPVGTHGEREASGVRRDLGKAKGASDCAWMTALRAEACFKGLGFCAAGSVHDFQKAYENINFALIWDVEGRSGFPLSLTA